MTLMKVLVLVMFGLTILGCATSSSPKTNWKAAKGQLMTRWAKDVSPTNAHPEYPRPQMVRKDWMNLNGVWQIAMGDESIRQDILVPFPPESALSGIMKHSDRLTYWKTFEVPKKWSGKRVMLNFGAVDWETIVSVNGKQVGTHRGGYDPFSFDITDALKDGTQELVVEVKDPTDKGDQPRGKQVLEPKGIWYTPTSGIWQTVWLEPIAKNGVTDLKIDTNIDAGTVTVQTGGTNASVEVLDGKKVTAKGSSGEPIKVPDAKLWSPDSPHLYNLRIRAGDDVVDSYFGMRKIEVKSDGKFNRLMLNGKELFQVGPLDQGFWPDGLYTAPTDEALRYDIEITKKLGFNMIRKHVKVEPARWYYWADKLGVVVWQDMPSADNKTPEGKKNFEIELKQLVDTHRNSPSIIMWVVFNEAWGQYDTERLTKWTKDFDPTRLVNNVSGWTDKNVGDVNDMHKYPGPGMPKPEEKRAVVLGEFGGLGLFIDNHTWAGKSFNYKGMKDAEELTSSYGKLMGRVWELRDQGLCAVVYTQTTDVEIENNGLLTYDREVIKPDLEKIAAANRGDIPRVKIQSVVPTSEHATTTWRYTFEEPAKEWSNAEFDASKWKQGPGGFGKPETPGVNVGTPWTSSDIWLRREFDLPAGSTDDLQIRFQHDDDCEIFINGVQAARGKRFGFDYVEHNLNAEGAKALKPGKNIMAVHCKQLGGGQFIDVGIVRLVSEKK